jgi:hypothetical protein
VISMFSLSKAEKHRDEVLTKLPLLTSARRSPQEGRRDAGAISEVGIVALCRDSSL